MKKIKLYLLVLSVAFMFNACDDGFLDLYPIDSITGESFWKTTGDLELYLNTFYPSFFPAHSGWYTTFYAENNSDNLVPELINSRLNGTTTLPASGGAWDWGTVRQINFFFENYSSAVGVGVDIDHFKGEAHFFKAAAYFNLLKAFGDLPWYDKVLGPNDEELYSPRNSRELVADSILSNLDKAIQLLKPMETAPQDRLNREIAMLFKSRVALFEGTWHKYHAGTDFGVAGSDGSSYIRQAKDIAEQLINEGKYSISTGNPATAYWSLFNQTSLTGNPEVMMGRQMSANLGLTHNVMRMLPWTGGQTGISLSLIESYLNTDGTLADNVNYNTLTSVASGRDPRLAQTFLLPGDVLTDADPTDGSAVRIFTRPFLDYAGSDRNTTGFMLYKGISPDPSQQKNMENIGLTASVVFRYAEVLLNYAEACAELGEFDQDAANKSVNLLRRRIGMADMQLASLPSDPNNILGVSDLIWEIRRERRVELAFEDFRFYDLMRWRAHELFTGVDNTPKGMKMADTDFGKDFSVSDWPSLNSEGFIEPYQSIAPSGYGFNADRDYLQPLPLDQFVLNPGLKQNPGWD